MVGNRLWKGAKAEGLRTQRTSKIPREMPQRREQPGMDEGSTKT